MSWVTNTIGSTEIPRAITTGPDGALWFVEADNTIGRITTSGSITDYPVPQRKFHEVEDITAGPDGALWFTDTDDYIGRITTGGIVSSYRGVPTPSPGKRAYTYEQPTITAGPDGALWFSTAPSANSIGRISTWPASG
jgi:virginiamycin B lyase